MKLLFLLLLAPSLAFGQAFTFSDIPFLGQGVTDWARRVVLNGGAMPSANTIQAMEILRKGCIAAGITNKIWSLCVFVPDSVEACRTPLFYHAGFTNWGNSNFVSGDLTVNGLKGNGTDKYLNTGIISQDILSSGNPPRGMTAIVTESSSDVTKVVMGQRDGPASFHFTLLVSTGTGTAMETEWIAGHTDNDQIVDTNDCWRVGYVSAQLTTNVTTNITIYVASPLETHKLWVNEQTPGNENWGGSASATETIGVFTQLYAGTNFAPSNQRLSLAMVTKGFTQAEDSAFWNLALAARQQMGGGTGDPIHNFNTKVVEAGGANISTTTSNALRTLYDRFNTHGLLEPLVVVNPIVPDNLVAVRTPVIAQAGSEIWTNFNFGTTNISVDGLQGNGSDKYLGTGITPSTANRISATSGGISGIVTANPGTASAIILGGTPVTANVQTILLLSAGGADSILYRMWRNDLINQNCLQSVHPSPGDTWTGYISGNRTAADAIALYVASTSLSHQVLTNATGTQNGSAAANTTSLLAFANNNNGTVSGPGNHTMSFVAWHRGLTQTQSSNLYNAAAEFRTAVGGGSP